MRAFLPVLLVLLLLPLAGAQPDGRMRGDPTSAKPDPQALGALGGEGVALTGEAAAEAGVRPPAAGIEVTSVISGGCGEAAGLLPGDVLVGVSRRPLRAEPSPFLQLAELLEAPRREGEAVELRVVRDGETRKLEAVLPGARHSRDCPTDCARCKAILTQALQTLAGMQKGDGSFPTPLGGANGQTAVTTIAGLAFLAAGSTPEAGDYAEVVKKARDWLVANAGHERDGSGNMGGKNWSQVNWSLGYAPLFLARVQAVSPTDEVKAKLVAMRDSILANMEPSGGWAHGPRNENPYPLDYAELVVVGNLCLASLGEIARVGIEVPKDKIMMAVDYIDRSSDGAGGVGYSTQPGQQGVGSAGRTAGALYALSRCGLSSHPFAKKLAAYYRRHLEQIPNGHVSPDFHLFFGALAARFLGDRDWRVFASAFRTEILSVWNGDGTFGVRPADTSRFGMPNTDRTMGPAWRTATFALILALDGSDLYEED